MTKIWLDSDPGDNFYPIFQTLKEFGMNDLAQFTDWLSTFMIKVKDPYSGKDALYRDLRRID